MKKIPFYISILSILFDTFFSTLSYHNICSNKYQQKSNIENKNYIKYYLKKKQPNINPRK